MKYKLLLLDVDGVLVKSKEVPISDKVIHAISKVKNQLKIALCTGRTRRDLQQILDVLDINNSYHVIESGAKILNPQGVEENIKALTPKNVNWIVTTAGGTPQGYSFCVNGIWVEDLNKIADRQITTVSLHSQTQEQTKKILEAIKPIFSKYHVAVASHWQIPNGNFILITHPEASKGLAVKYVQKKLGIAKEQTLAVGDMPNDIPLFATSGFKVAMGNADEELKKAADYIAPSINDDGVAYVVDNYCF